MTQLASKFAFATLGVTAIFTSPALAAVSYTADDLFLGFRNASAEYVIDLGQASAFRTATAPLTLSLGAPSALASDLASVFGPNWATDNTISYSVLGTTQNTRNRPTPDNQARLIYLSEPAGSVSDPTLLASADQSDAANQIGSFANYFAAAPVGQQKSVPNSASRSNTDANSYSSLIDGFASTSYFPIESGLSTSLDLFRLPQTVTDSTYEGSFSFNSGAGTVSFAPELAPIPEPGTALFGAVLVLGTSLRRRRSVAV